MKIELESTDKIVVLDTGNGSVPARVWEGRTDFGVPVVCLITRIAPDIENPPDDVTRRFEAELQSVRAPRAKFSDVIPMRMIL